MTYKYIDKLERLTDYTIIPKKNLRDKMKRTFKKFLPTDVFDDDFDFYHMNAAMAIQVNYAALAVKYYWQLLEHDFHPCEEFQSLLNCWTELFRLTDDINEPLLAEILLQMSKLSPDMAELIVKYDKLRTSEYLALNFMLSQLESLDYDRVSLDRIVMESQNDITQKDSPYHLQHLCNEAEVLKFLITMSEYPTTAGYKRVKCECCLRLANPWLQLKKCVACKLVSYCSVACQKEHWKKHKTDCKNEQQKEKRSTEKDDDSRGLDDCGISNAFAKKKILLRRKKLPSCPQKKK